MAEMTRSYSAERTLKITQWLALALLTAIPYSAVLVAIAGLLRLRKGFLFLSLLAISSWGGAVLLLWPVIAPYFPVNLSPDRAACLATMAALLLHRRPIITGARDRGFVKMRLMAERDETVTWRKPKFATQGPMAGAQPWVAPNPRGRSAIAARRVRRALPWGLFVAVACDAYVFRNQIADGAHTLTSGLVPEQHDSAGPDEAIATRDDNGQFVFDATINGAALQAQYDPQASFLTLSAETADRLGLSRGNDSASNLTRTASGFVHVTPVVIDTMTVGNITVSHLMAYVARSGELPGNILGQSFLQRLASHIVLRNRLILKGRV